MALLAKVNLQRQGWSLQANLKLPASGVCAIYGPSGCGKTSLLRLIAGLDQGEPDNEIALGTTAWQKPGFHLPAEQRAIGFVFQDGRLFPHLSVTGNIAFAFKRRFSEQGPGPEQVMAWMGIDNMGERMPAELSGGEQQRVAIARALVSAPQLLLLDEPLSGLDSANREKTMSLLENLHRELSIPVLYVSHQVDEVMRLADHVILMDDGKVSGSGDIATMTTSLDSPLAQQNGAGTVVVGEVQAHDQAYGLTEITLGQGITLQIAACSARVGAKVRLRIPANAVSLSASAATDSSVLNILPVSITGWQELGNSHVMVQLTLGEHRLLSRITRKSWQRMALAAGQDLYAQIKGVALLSDYG